MSIFEADQEFWRAFVLSERQNDTELSLMVVWETYCMGGEL
jgi:hypothetical protein